MRTCQRTVAMMGVVSRIVCGKPSSGQRIQTKNDPPLEMCTECADYALRWGARNVTRTPNRQALAEAFALLGEKITDRIPRGGDGFPHNLTLNNLMDEFLDLSPFWFRVPDPTATDGKLLLCGFCGREEGDPSPGCPNHEIERLARVIAKEEK
jgi:hypothetical protein